MNHVVNVRGYGIRITDLTQDAANRFVLAHKSCIEETEILAAAEKGLSLEEWENVLETEDDYGHIGIGPVIADIMAKETGILFEIHRDSEDNEAAVMLSYCAPWEYTETEKNLTSDRMNRILHTFADELGLPAIDVGTQSIDYIC